MTTIVESVVEAFLNETRDWLRVDTHRGACRWFRIHNGSAQSFSLRSVWQSAQHAALRAGLQVSQTNLARAIRASQGRVAVLTEAEWQNTTAATPLRAAPRWRRDREAA